MIHNGCFIFRALRVPAGEHEVAMTYTPYGYPWTVAISWSLLAAVAMGSVIQVMRARHRRRGERK